MKYNHQFAYCKIPYINKDGEKILVWNSRDGFVPETFKMQGIEYRRVNLFVAPKPEYEPVIGDYLFRDLTKTEIEIYSEQMENEREKFNNRAQFRMWKKATLKKLQNTPIVVQMQKSKIANEGS